MTWAQPSSRHAFARLGRAQLRSTAKADYEAEIDTDGSNAIGLKPITCCMGLCVLPAVPQLQAPADTSIRQKLIETQPRAALRAMDWLDDHVPHARQLSQESAAEPVGCCAGGAPAEPAGCCAGITSTVAKLLLLLFLLLLLM